MTQNHMSCTMVVASETSETYTHLQTASGLLAFDYEEPTIRKVRD